MKTRDEALEKFAARIRKNSVTGCYEWSGAKRKKGDAIFYFHNKYFPAHKWLFERVNGRVKKGFKLFHVCGNRSCVNPAHVKAIAHAEKQRENARKAQIAGKRMGNEKLQQWEVGLIRALHAIGDRPSTFRSRFAVKEPELYHIIEGRTWKLLPSLPDVLRGLKPQDREEISRRAVAVLEGGKELYEREGWPVKESFVELLEECRGAAAGGIR